MKLVITLFSICMGCLLIILLAPYPEAIAQPSVNGIVVRQDGSVLIDAWKNYSASRLGNPSANLEIKTEDAPTKITLGQSLSGSLPICFEAKTETKCFFLDKLRSAK